MSKYIVVNLPDNTNDKLYTYDYVKNNYGVYKSYDSYNDARFVTTYKHTYWVSRNGIQISEDSVHKESMFIKCNEIMEINFKSKD